MKTWGRWIAFAVATAGASACELMTHSSNYAPYQGLCNACPPSAGTLRRPFCPPDRAPDDVINADGGSPANQRYVYAWRTFTLGGNPAALTDPAYSVGFNQDCSTRADGGRPALCIPFPGNSGDAIQTPPWTPLPQGIDNAVGQRIIAPLVSFAASINTTIDIDGTVSKLLENGSVGQIVVVDGWNGLPDDADVTVSFVGSGGTTAPPAWQGSDIWVANGTVASYPKFAGYVSQGQLVVDTRAVGQDDLSFTIPDQNGNPVSFSLIGRLTVRAGAITPDSLTLETYGRFDLGNALAQVDGLVSLWIVSGTADAGNPIADILRANLPDLFRAGADLPLGEQATLSSHCAAISFEIRAGAQRALVVDPP